jgi:DUF971 family protein
LVRPRSVTLSDARVGIEWSDGHRSTFSNKSLREACPCALCQGEMNPLGGSRVLPMVPDVPADVVATQYRMVGLYAIAFAWSDGHSTGIYPYDYLLARCECDACTAKRKK